MEYNFGFGQATLRVGIPNKNVLGCLLLNKAETEPSEGEEEVKRALNNPIASIRLKDVIKQGERIVIITSDISRPMPSKLVLPSLLQELYNGGVQDRDITIVFGLGSHRPHTEDEQRHLVGDDIYNRIRCIDSDPSNCARLGFTSTGTPVDIFRPVAEADRRICLGNIEYHYFAGYSGGAKALMPGVSSREAIQANHSRMLEQGARAGNINGNPVRSDIEEIARFLSIDYILNVVLDDKKNIAKAVAGDYIEAHRVGCRFLDTLYQIKIPKTADIVITSPGGFPKDLNLYQAQKALDNAKYAVRPGGIIILVAACQEGLGEEVFERWMLEAQHPEELTERIKQNFQLGGHKAAAIAELLRKAKIFLVSELQKDLVVQLFMEHFGDLQSAVDRAFREVEKDATVLLMPNGGSTLPVAQ